MTQLPKVGAKTRCGIISLSFEIAEGDGVFIGPGAVAVLDGAAASGYLGVEAVIEVGVENAED
jgi:hypothetical protein